MSAPRWLYKLHGDIVVREFDGRGMRWRDHAALAAVRWVLDRFELWQLRYGPTAGCPNCRHYDSICDGCRSERKKVWG